MTTLGARDARLGVTPAGCPHRIPAQARRASAVALLTLISTAAMLTGFPVVSPLIWAVALLGVAIGCAFAARRSGSAQLAAEPFAMGLMVILSMFHSAIGDGTGGAHEGHALAGGLLVTGLSLAIGTLSVTCLISASRGVRTVGLLRGALPLIAAVVMCITTAAMVLAV